MTKRIAVIGLSLVLLLGLVLAACAPKEPTTTPTPTPTTPPAQQEKLLDKVIEAAKQEGEVNFLTASPFKAEDLEQGVKDRFGVDLSINLVTGQQTAALATTVMEISTGTPPALDVMQMAIGNAISVGKPGGAIADIDWQTLISEAGDIDPTLYLAEPANVMTPWGYIDIPMYDSSKVSPDDLPQSYYDFTDPKWKGKFGWMGFVAPNIETVHALGLSEEDGLQFIKDVVANKPDLGRLQAQKAQLQMGELVMTLGASRDLNRMNNQDPNNTIEWSLLEEYIQVNEHTHMVVTDAPNINAATLLVLFLCTPEGMKVTETADVYWYKNPATLEYKVLEAAEKAGIKAVYPSRDKEWLEYLLSPEYAAYSEQIDLALKGAKE